MKTETLPVRGLLLHITHYDPRWWEQKDEESRFALDVALDTVAAMATCKMNLLVIDCADGVLYESHPELARHYSVPMHQLSELAAEAKERGIEVVPKLNFAQSHYHHHNDWFRPYHRLFDNPEYWDRAFQLIDELITATQPARYFHIGMDEDHNRAYSQYIGAILTLHEGLARRNVTPIIWNDSPHAGAALIHAEKSLAAEDSIPTDIVQVPWDYRRRRPEIIERLVSKGFPVWGAPGRSMEQVAGWREDLIKLGGQGILLTNWIGCTEENRAELLDQVNNFGPLCGSPE